MRVADKAELLVVSLRVGASTRRSLTRSAEDGEGERPIEGVVLLIEDLDVDRVRTGAARIEVVVLEEGARVLTRGREVDAAGDVGVEADAVDADAGSGRRCCAAVLRQCASGIATKSLVAD